MADSLAKDYPIGLYNGFIGYTGLLPRSLSISEADSFAPRVTSTKGETDLDGTLHYTFPVDHGFDKTLSDDNKNYRVVGNYNPVDGNLYPTIEPTSISTGSTYLGSSGYFSAKVSTYNETYIAYRENTTNVLYKVNTAGTRTTITLPAAISGSSSPITSLMFWKNYLFVAGETSSTYFNLHRYNITAGTWQDVSGYGTHWFKIRESLYHINRSSGIYLGSNLEAVSSATWTLLKICGPSSPTTDLPQAAVEWNGAAWIAKKSGLYRFDGVDAVQVYDKFPQYLHAHQGALYWLNNGWLYRFTGSLIEKIKYFGSAELITDIQSHQDNLYILTSTNSTTYKYAGSTADGTIDHRIFEYDGVNFRVVYEGDQTNPSWLLLSVGNLLIRADGSSVAAAATLYKYDLATRYQATTSALQNAYVLTADFDGDLPNINKLLRRIQVDLTNPLAADTVTVKFEAYSSGSWSGPWTLGTLTDLDDPSSMNVLLAPKASLVNVYDFERIRLHITLTPSVGSSVSLTSATLHYTLHPQQRRRISVTVPVINGTDSHHAISQLDGELVYPTPTTLSSRLYAYSNLISYSDSFTWLIGPESWDVRTAITTGSTSVQVKGQLTIYDFPGNYNYLPTFALLDTDQGNLELVRAHSSFYDQTNDYTTLTFHARGAFGTTAVAATTSYVLMPAIQLSRMRLISQHIIPDQTTFATDANGTRQIERDITYELTEL